MKRADGLVCVGLSLMVFILINILVDIQSSKNRLNSGIGSASSLMNINRENMPNYSLMFPIVAKSGQVGNIADSSTIQAPYVDYIITQGPHGNSYGHEAIDISAGKGAIIMSPINGLVTQLYVDEWGNPTLVIENNRYQVSMLHGRYTVNVGDYLMIGDPIGYESNLGYTLDYAGRPCYGRDCGYHTHLNIFDKLIGENVNPLLLIK